MYTLHHRVLVRRICIITLKRRVRTQPAYTHSHARDKVESQSRSQEHEPVRGGLVSPRQLVEYLNDYVVGQERAKKILAVAVYNHYNRVRANIGFPDELSSWAEPTAVSPSNDLQLLPHPLRRRSFPPLRPQAPELEKSNVLVIGPTGSGKTLLARTLARVLDVPFSVSDATSFTQAGYVGDDVEMCVHRLLQASNWDPHRAGTGIIYIDEADKLARRTGGDQLQRDVSGEGVQQSLLRMMEGSVVTVNANPSASSSGMGAESGEGRRGRAMTGPTQETYQVDTSNVLFILSGAFVGLDKVIKRRIAKGSIGFGAPLPTQEGEGSFKPFFTKNGEKADAWSLVEPIDLATYGYIPEFVSRLPILASLNPLTMADLLRILTEVKSSLVSQYTSLFSHSGVEIRFTTPALRAIAQKAYDRGGGARGLRGIMESLLLDAMYDVPGSGVRYVLVDEGVVVGEKEAGYWSRGEGTAFWRAWSEEEERDKREQNDMGDKVV